MLFLRLYSPKSVVNRRMLALFILLAELREINDRAAVRDHRQLAVPLLHHLVANQIVIERLAENIVRLRLCLRLNSQCLGFCLRLDNGFLLLSI